MIFKIDNIDNKARATTIETTKSIIQTPVFMPVGTQATIKSLDSNDLNNFLNPEIILAIHIIYIYDQMMKLLIN